ncbi:MAG: HNH endonuclease [Ktedonobacteraceae bacterium]|nr:HNH endonuclease [Ktedonobacteraceae bacterium]
MRQDDELIHVENTPWLESLAFSVEHVFEGCQCEGEDCRRCEQVLCVGAFNRDKSRKSGLDKYCRECRHTLYSAYYQANADKERSRIRKYHKAHPEQLAKRKRVFYQNNPEYNQTYLKAWYQGNRERHKFYRKTRRARKRNAEGSFTTQEWAALKSRYEHKCLCCGKSESEVLLSIDHVVPLSQGGANKADNIQPLCLSCNKKKGTKAIDYRL